MTVLPLRGLAIGLVAILQLASSSPASAVCADVLFVRNNGPNGTGTQQDPLNALPFVVPPPFEVVYLFIGSATTLNQDQGIILGQGQKLIGETIGYQDDCNDIPATLSAALPAITNLTGSAPVTLTGDNEVAGIRVLGSSLGLGISGTFNVGSNIHENEVEAASIFLSFTAGTTRIADNEVRDAPGAAIVVVHSGDPMALSIENNLVEDGDAEAIALSTMPFGSDMGDITVRNNTIRRMDNEGIELDELTAQFLIEDNSVSDMRAAGIEIEETRGVGLLRGNDFETIDPEAIFVRVSDTNALDLTIESNEILDARGFLGDNFGDGMEIEARDSASLVALVRNNTVDGKGNTGIDILSTESSSMAVRVESNTVRDVRFSGIRLDVSGAGLLQAEVERNDVDRSGSEGLRISVSSSTLAQSVAVLDNDVDDSGEDGIEVTLSGGPPRQFDLAVDSNRIHNSASDAIDLSGSTVGGGEFTFSVRSNTVVGNADEGVRVGIAGATQADGHIEANVFAANTDLYAVDANASGDAALCTVLANNQADNDYRLRGSSMGIHIWEDLLGTNSGDVALENNGAQTFGPVGVGSCDEVMLAEVPEPLTVEFAPEPSRAGPAALLALAGLARWRRARG